MEGIFSAVTKSTAVNFIAIIHRNETYFDFVLDFIKVKLISEKSICRFGSMIGAFIIGNAENQTQKIIKMALPLHFSENDTEWYFEYNFNNLLLQGVETDYDNETCFQNYLKNAQNGPDLNQTLIFYIDSIPPCINLNSFWNKTKHHLEVIVHGFLSDNSYARTLNLIAPNQNNKTNLKNKYSQNEILRKNDETSEVAVKVLTNFVNADDVEEFVRELDALILVGTHSNIINFYGWTLQQQIPALITELAETDLLQYVRKLRGLEFPIKQILSILWQITLALEHIALLSMVHRDVACRNILLTESGTAKLADFGLCCHCDESFTYRASLQKRLPLKWLSIEALIDRLFSEKSDVWSFGILCYEAFSDGSVPYPALSNTEMLKALQNGKRLEKPIKSSNEIYELMLKCWKEQPAERPTFKDLNKELKIILENETRNYGYLSLDFSKTLDS
uniref:Protein kinase domain-containing protein n=1 Tax=Panagrolaimus sp. ES5 TaxID=591445 RepID=A0AC34FDM3_9BILA